MANVGRFFCVALPFILTAISIVCMLVAGLAGVANNNSLYLFQVNLTDLSISPSSVTNLVNAVTARQSTSTSNITAADLGLDDVYHVNLWGYCRFDQDGVKTCTKPKFDWAEKALNTSYITSAGIGSDSDSGSGTGTGSSVNITMPDEIQSALRAYKAVNKWTEVVFIVAMLGLGAELFFGLFTQCSTAVSCVTYLVSGVALVLVCGAAAMLTATASIVIGAVKASARAYGVHGHMNRNFLVTIWLGAAFAIGASVFWLWTVCCCKPARRSRTRSVAESDTAIPTGSYKPLHDGGYAHSTPYGAPGPQVAAAPRSNMAYEPCAQKP